ncbi:hypothetical protein OESDEN_09964 [Oesophagostomum dentatum]|uniref:RRM domain-containing protein n=1 Tax=Oesophagostomum dentatum TaxID=61180 RepID=A0A0B1T4A2_OESDE|nr:hypothetical protein OESDEN_09964 [Oesophagostomum dentatum]
MVVVVASPPQNQNTRTTVASSSHPGRDMGRESRHVYVSGLPDSVSDERISAFFSTCLDRVYFSYGRVHQIERTSDGIVVSFMDVRSAQKAHAGDHRLDSGLPFKIAFHEPGGAKKYCILINSSELFSRLLLFFWNTHTLSSPSSSSFYGRKTLILLISAAYGGVCGRRAPFLPPTPHPYLFVCSVECYSALRTSALTTSSARF